MRNCGRTHGGRKKKLLIAWHFSWAGESKKPVWQCEHCQRSGIHKQRNCHLYFPADVDPARRPCWSARGSVKVRDRVREWNIPDTSTSECPVSLITAESLMLLRLVADHKSAKDAGASLFGSNAGRWPARFFDALQIVQVAEAEYIQRQTEFINAGN